MLPWIPPKNDFVILDTNVISAMRRGVDDFCEQYTSLVDSFESSGVKIVIPKVVQYELLRNARNLKEYEDTLNFFEEKIEWDMPKAVTDAATMINALYCWNESTKNFGQGDIFNDLIVGATAAFYEKKTNKCAYILSSDHDFREPYFKLIKSYVLENEQKKKLRYAFIFRANRHVINQDWKKYKAWEDQKRKISPLTPSTKTPSSVF